MPPPERQKVWRYVHSLRPAMDGQTDGQNW